MIRSRLCLHGIPIVESSRECPGWFRRWLWQLLGGRWVKVPREDAANWGAVAMEEDIEAM